MKKMHSGKFNFKKALYLVLALVFIIGSLPSGSYASGSEEPGQEAVVAAAETVGEEETVEPETTEQEPEAQEPEAQEPEESSITYDLQPTSLAEVQAAIDAYETEYQTVLAADGYLKAIEVAKPHWQYEVAAELIPAGYHCELVDWDEGFGADYYTFFVGAATTQIIWAPGEIIVENEQEFRDALGNATYTTIYLGADITMQTNTRATVAARTGTTLVINGTDPRDGTRYTYKDRDSANAYETLTGPCNNIMFKDITLHINTIYGIYDSGASGETITFDGVTGDAAQYFLGYGALSTFVVKDSVLTLTKTHTTVEEFVQNVGTMRFEGDVTVTRDQSTSYDEIFYLTGAGATVEIANGANVTINNNVDPGYYGGAVFYDVKNINVGTNASFSCYSAAGFGNIDGYGVMDSVTIGAGSDVRFICTTSHYWGTGGTYSSALRGTNFTAGAGSNFLLYNTTDNTTTGAFRFSNVTLNNPESFIVMNPSARAIGTNLGSLIATGVSSIRYYSSGQISSLYNAGTGYTPSRVFDRWWANDPAFNVTATNWASAAAPTLSVNTYTSAKVPSSTATIQTAIASGTANGNNNISQFSAGAYGIEIYGTIYKLTYDGNNADSGTAPASDAGVPGDKITLPGNTGNLVRDGYTFKGWNTQADGGGTAYSAGDTFTFTEDTTLYADWEPNKYTVSGTLSGLPTVSGLSVSYTIDGGVTQTVTTDSGGNYTITDVNHGSEVVITPPTQTEYTVNPASITVSSISADSPGKDFTYTLILVDVTVSKTVTGDYADTTKAFTFTVYFEDSADNRLSSGTEFFYTGGVISGSGATAPANDKLTLDSEGKATFTLGHGQTITIAGVAANGKVRVVETNDANYKASFEDSIVPGSTSGNDTTMRNMTTSDRTFDFTNVRDAVVPSGIAADSGGMLLLVLLAIPTLAAGLAITIVYRRRRARTR